MIIVTDAGFSEDGLATAFSEGRYGELTLEQLADGLPSQLPDIVGITFPVDGDMELITSHLQSIHVIKVPFASFADGRGFSIATELRRAGYTGTLRATGHVITDQYAHARRCGFDEVAISDEQAKRQPEDQWLAEVPKINRTYQNRLQQAAVAV